MWRYVDTVIWTRLGIWVSTVVRTKSGKSVFWHLASWHRQLSYFLACDPACPPVSTQTFENTVCPATCLHFDLISVDATGVLSNSN